MTGFCQCDEVGIDALDADARYIAAVHVVLDLLEAAVFPDHDRQRQPQFGRGDQFRYSEHGAAVAGDDRHRRPRSGEPGADRVRQRIAERAVTGRVKPAARTAHRHQERAAVDQLAGVTRPDQVIGRDLGERAPYRGMLFFRRAQIVFDFAAYLAYAGFGRGPARGLMVPQRRGERRHRGFGIRDDADLGGIKIVGLGRIDIDPDQPAADIHAFDEAVGFGQLGADGENDVGLG